MKKFLAIAFTPPMPDLYSGDLRFFSILSLLCKFGQVTLVIRDLSAWRLKVPEHQRYEAMYVKAGIRLYDGNVFSAINSDKFDLVFFEFYYTTKEFFDLARRLQPQALLVVDTVDVHFNRLQAKAALTGDLDDLEEAKQVRAEELTAYKKADVVVAVSEDDKKLLQQVLPHKCIEVLPNVHAIHSASPRSAREFGRLIFIGGFGHAPNVDAVHYFLNEVMPLIRARVAGVRLSIIGSKIPADIVNMADSDVDVIGYVPDTAPYLQSAYISIAPLRFGGGMKGKVGEAMSHGLPVVTTAFGAEGFGLTPGVHLLVGDSADTFADAVVRLLNDTDCYDELGHNGHRFISDNYSMQAMEAQLAAFLLRMESIAPSKLSWLEIFIYNAKSLFTRYIGWRLKDR